jgi:hypothetical protein
VRLERSGKLKKSASSGTRTDDLPACSIVPQPRAPRIAIRFFRMLNFKRTLPAYLVRWKIRMCSTHEQDALPRKCSNCTSLHYRGTGSCTDRLKGCVGGSVSLTGTGRGRGKPITIFRSFRLGVGTVVAQSAWRLDYGLKDRGIGARIPVGAKGPLCPDRLWGPFCLLHNRKRELCPRR